MKKFFENMRTLADVKREYHRLTKIHHPDVGGDTATMQEINRQYKEALRWIEIHGERPEERRAAAAETPEEFIAVVSAIAHLDGITVEIVGSWIWITGNTWPNRDAIKAAGCRWSKGKRAWYWHPEDAGCRRGGKKSLEEIRFKYGSELLDLTGYRRLQLA